MKILRIKHNFKFIYQSSVYTEKNKRLMWDSPLNTFNTIDKYINKETDLAW